MEEKKSPWMTIWTSPRATIDRVVRDNPNQSIWWLAFIEGFDLTSFSQSYGIFILAIIIAPLYGYVSFCVRSWLVYWTGKMFKGQGTYKAIRASLAWSCVPLIINIPLWLLMVGIFGHQLFLDSPDAHLLSGGKVFALCVFIIARAVLAIWSLVIYFNALAEVQKYSILRAILNHVAAGFVLCIVIIILFSLLIYASNNMAVSPTFYKPF